MNTCRRWRSGRILSAMLALVWVVLVDSTLAGSALLSATLLLPATLDTHRTRAWLDSHAFMLATLLTFSSQPITACIGAAMLPMATLALFAPLALGPARRTIAVVVLAGLLVWVAVADAHVVVFAMALGAFLSLRPFAALGEVLRALGLHRGPLDPMLAWRPLRPPRGVT